MDKGSRCVAAGLGDKFGKNLAGKGEDKDVGIEGGGTDRENIGELITKSKRAWIHNGILERYWSKGKQKRKKGIVKEKVDGEGEGEGEVDEVKEKEKKRSMIKCGRCRIVVEPHIFDVVMYTVKRGEGGSSAAMVGKGTETSAKTTSSTSGTETMATFSGTATINTSTTICPEQVPVPTPQCKPDNPKPANPDSSAAPPAKPQQLAAPDKVIQLLAQRASVNEELKQVMKIVASGHANTKQLEYFQRHIDELTMVVRKMEMSASITSTNATSSVPIAVITPASHPVASIPSKKSRKLHSTSGTGDNANQAALNHSNAIATEPINLLIEFHGNQNDRWLFPRMSVVEFEATNVTKSSWAIVSFFVLTDAKGGSVIKEREFDWNVSKILEKHETIFYAPITLRFIVDKSEITSSIPSLNLGQPFSLALIERAVESKVVVLEYMKEIIQKSKPISVR